METPTVGFREYVTGARPIAGAIGACGLMLVACSLFVLRPSDLGAGTDVGTPGPVRIDDTQAQPKTRPAPSHPSRARHVGALTRTTVAPIHVQLGPSHRSSPARPGPQTTPARASTPTPATEAPAATASAPTPTATTPTETPPPTPPQPVVQVPPVSLPPVSVPPVSVPQVPSVTVPDLSKTASTLGLP
jgi:hypothetical protein